VGDIGPKIESPGKRCDHLAIRLYGVLRSSDILCQVCRLIVFDFCSRCDRRCNWLCRSAISFWGCFLGHNGLRFGLDSGRLGLFFVDVALDDGLNDADQGNCSGSENVDQELADSLRLGRVRDKEADAAGDERKDGDDDFLVAVKRGSVHVKPP